MPRHLLICLLLPIAIGLAADAWADAADSPPAAAAAAGATDAVQDPVDSDRDAERAATPPAAVRPQGPRAAILTGPARQRHWLQRHLGLEQRAPGQRQPVANPRGLVDLPGQDGPVLALTHAARGSSLLGRVVLLADGAGSALGGRMGRLHRYLRDHGWNVLTLPLPVQRAATLPPRTRARYSAATWQAAMAPAGEAGIADAGTDAAADTDAATDADAQADASSDALADAGTAAEVADAAAEAGADTTPALPWPEQVAYRVQLALDAMGGGGDNRNVVVAEGAAGAAAVAHARRASVDLGVVWLHPLPLAGLDLTADAGAGADKGPVQVLALGAPGQDLGWLGERVSGARITALQLVADPRGRDDDRINRRIRGWLERRVQRPD